MHPRALPRGRGTEECLDDNTSVLKQRGSRPYAHSPPLRESPSAGLRGVGGV